MGELRAAGDHALAQAVEGRPGIHGVVAVATDRYGNIYEGAAGQRAQGVDAPMTLDTVFAIYSATKPITATAVLQLVEAGRLDLEAPAADYIPALGTVQVLDGYDAAGTPILRAPKRAITLRMLLTHTAGFGYDFCNPHYRKLAEISGRPRLTDGPETLLTPLLFDPGERWEYGANIEWAGLILEAVTGQRLGTYLREHVLDPLGMNDTGFSLTGSMGERLATVHQRGADDGLIPMHRTELPPPPTWDRGGGGMYSTALDYARFMRMWLGDGGGVLRPETVRMASQNAMGALKVTMLPGVMTHLSNDAEFFPGMPKSWGLSFMINDHDAPTGRPAGSLAWAGLANVYFWIDRTTGVAGFWATQILPFVDPAAINGFHGFETAIYRDRARQSAA
ncbi:MAG: serine hydrolase domain-containing protein [Janthinobacterium lividum]